MGPGHEGAASLFVGFQGNGPAFLAGGPIMSCFLQCRRIWLGLVCWRNQCGWNGRRRNRRLPIRFGGEAITPLGENQRLSGTTTGCTPRVLHILPATSHPFKPHWCLRHTRSSQLLLHCRNQCPWASDQRLSLAPFSLPQYGT